MPSPRAATTRFAVPSRRSTLEWSGAVAAEPEAPVAPPHARRWSGDDSTVGPRRRPMPSWVVAALVSAVVSAGTVGVLTTVGPLSARPEPVAAGATAKEPSTTRQDTGWQPLPVGGGFVVTGDGARYRVVDGVCHLQVHLRDPDGIWAANSPIAMLPQSARPAWNHGFVVNRDGVPYSEVGIYDDGQVLMTRPGDGVAGWLTFSATFPVGD